MTETHSESTDHRDVPDVASEVPKGVTMSDMISRSEFERVQRQNLRRKQELQHLQSQLQSVQAELQQAQTQRDEAVQTMTEITEQYKQFTDQDTLFRENQELRTALKSIAVEDAIYGSLPDGVGLQNGVGLSEILGAAGIDFDSIEDINEEFVTETIGRAQAAKPFLFTVSHPSTGGDQPGDVRQDAAQQPSLRAFGSQAVGGGAPTPMAGPDPVKTVDWSNPAAALNFRKGD